MINFARIRELIFESYEARLISRGVSQEIIEYIASLNSSDRGGVISKVMSNPKLSLDDVRLKEKFRVKNNAQHKMILDADPTPDKSYYEILAKWFTVDKTISLPNDTERTTEVLDYYNKNKRRFATAYITKYKTFQELEQEYLTLSGKKSKRREIKDIKVDGSTKMYENSTWVGYAVTTYEASCFYGSGTTWCTASNRSSSAFDDYARRGPLRIFVNKKTSEKYQASADYGEFRDAEDVTVYHSQMTPTELKSLLHFAYDAEINMKDKKHAKPDAVISLMVRRAIALPKGALETIIKDAIKDPENNFSTITLLTRNNNEIMKGAYRKEIEFILSHSTIYAVQYWLDQLNSKSVYHEFEKRIFTNYLNRIGHIQQTELRDIIKYAEVVHPRGWKKLEEFLVDRFDEIKKGSSRSTPAFENFVDEYIALVRMSRWAEAEEYLQASPKVWARYYQKFRNEMKDYDIDRLLKIGIWTSIVDYAMGVEGKRIPELEKQAFKKIGASEYTEDRESMQALKKYIMHFKIQGPLANAVIDQFIKSMRELIKRYNERTRIHIDDIMYHLEDMRPLMTGDHHKEIASLFISISADENIRRILIDFMDSWLPKGKRWIEFEDHLASRIPNSSDGRFLTSRLIFRYMEAVEITKQRIHPALEDLIGYFPYMAAEYAVTFLQSRFPIEEVHDDIMLQSANIGSQRAMGIIRSYHKLYR